MITDKEKMQGYTLDEFDELQRQKIIEASMKVWSLDDGPIKIIVPAFDINRYNISSQTKEEARNITTHNNFAFGPVLAASMIEWILIYFSRDEMLVSINLPT